MLIPSLPVARRSQVGQRARGHQLPSQGATEYNCSVALGRTGKRCQRWIVFKNELVLWFHNACTSRSDSDIDSDSDSDSYSAPIASRIAIRTHAAQLRSWPHFAGEIFGES